MSKSPRQLAIELGEGTYVSAKHPCRRCKGRKRYTANYGCKRCIDALGNATAKRRRENAKLQAEANATRVKPAHSIVGIPTCPHCGQPLPVEGK